MQAFDVVIIGAGIVGSSIAYHLTAAGCRNVLVLERESAQGKGSTGKSMGGVRAQFSTTVSIQMSLYSIPFYASFEERLGHPCDYRPQGYLFCATICGAEAAAKNVIPTKLGKHVANFLCGDTSWTLTAP
jgi:sarcosine oxidase, subunit beta